MIKKTTTYFYTGLYNPHRQSASTLLSCQASESHNSAVNQQLDSVHHTKEVWEQWFVVVTHDNQCLVLFYTCNAIKHTHTLLALIKLPSDDRVCLCLLCRWILNTLGWPATAGGEIEVREGSLPVIFDLTLRLPSAQKQLHLSQIPPSSLFHLFYWIMCIWSLI